MVFSRGVKLRLGSSRERENIIRENRVESALSYFTELFTPEHNLHAPAQSYCIYDDDYGVSVRESEHM